MLLRRTSDWIATRPVATIERLIVACVFLFIWGLDTHGTFAGSGDEPHYQMIAHSLVFDGDFDLSNDYADPANLVGAGNLEPGAHAIRGRGGTLRPVHDIGLPVLFAPYFAVAYTIAERSADWIPPRIMARARLNPSLVLRHLLSLAMIALTASMAVLVFRLCRRLSCTQTRAFVWTLLCVLSPPVLSHAYLFFTELPSALIVTGCWYALEAHRPRSRLRSALLGTAVGVLLLIHIRNAGFVVGLSALFVMRMRDDERRLAKAFWYFAPLAVALAVRTLVNFLFWGSFLTSPHLAPGPVPGFSATILEVVARACGLLVDQEHGLLSYAPIYLLALPGVITVWKADRKRCGEACLLVACYMLPVLLPLTNRHGWDGGWSPAARFLVPIAPIFIVLASGYVARARITITLSVLCLGQVLLDLIYWSHPKVLWNLGTGKSALAAFLSPPGVDVSRWLPCWHTPSSYTVASSLIGISLWVALSVRAVRRQASLGQPS
jgi:hypothetical protein